MKGSSAARMGMRSRLARWISAGMESTSRPEGKNAMMGTKSMTTSAATSADTMRASVHKFRRAEVGLPAH